MKTETQKTEDGSSLDVAAGSHPVSSAEALCLEWEKHAEASELAATNKEAIGMNSAAKQIRKYAEIYRRHSNQLRRLAGLPILRQPEENIVHEPHRGSPSPTE